MPQDSKYIVKLAHYDHDANDILNDGTITVNHIAKSMTTENFAELLDNRANNLQSSFERGVKAGKILQSTHRTLQRLVIVELLGVVAGLSDQLYTNARNEVAIATAKKVAALVAEEGLGRFI